MSGEMVDKSRALDNIIMQRLPRSVKYEEVYLADYETPKEALAGPGSCLLFCKQERPHPVLEYLTPATVHAEPDAQARNFGAFISKSSLVSGEGKVGMVFA